MSKKNRYKFRNRENISQPAAAVSPAPVRSGSENPQTQHAAEYRIISRDLLRLVVLNGIMLIAVLALFYANRQSGIVEHLYQQLF